MHFANRCHPWWSLLVLIFLFLSSPSVDAFSHLVLSRTTCMRDTKDGNSTSELLQIELCTCLVLDFPLPRYRKFLAAPFLLRSHVVLLSWVALGFCCWAWQNWISWGFQFGCKPKFLAEVCEDCKLKRCLYHKLAIDEGALVMCQRDEECFLSTTTC